VKFHVLNQIQALHANQLYLQFALDRAPTLRRPSLPFNHHVQSASTSSLSTDNQSIYQYAPSTFAPSTLAASTIMPNLLMQPVRNTATTTWAEGHSLEWKPNDMDSICSICDDRTDEGIYRCSSEFSLPRLFERVLDTYKCRLQYKCSRPLYQPDLSGVPNCVSP
jgi:hypothetical protein